jgi:hypothetical protein
MFKGKELIMIKINQKNKACNLSKPKRRQEDGEGQV